MPSDLLAKLALNPYGISLCLLLEIATGSRLQTKRKRGKNPGWPFPLQI
jgi:hypothetical protein